MLDLFCGLGNFTLPLARKAAVVRASRATPAWCRARPAMPRANGLANVRFGPPTSPVPDAATRCWRGEAGGLLIRVLLDPPRTGAAEVLGPWR